MLRVACSTSRASASSTHDARAAAGSATSGDAVDVAGAAGGAGAIGPGRCRGHACIERRSTATDERNGSCPVRDFGPIAGNSSLPDRRSSSARPPRSRPRRSTGARPGRGSASSATNLGSTRRPVPRPCPRPDGSRRSRTTVRANSASSGSSHRCKSQSPPMMTNRRGPNVSLGSSRCRTGWSRAVTVIVSPQQGQTRRAIHEYSAIARRRGSAEGHFPAAGGSAAAGIRHGDGNLAPCAST